MVYQGGSLGTLFKMLSLQASIGHWLHASDPPRTYLVNKILPCFIWSSSERRTGLLPLPLLLLTLQAGILGRLTTKISGSRSPGRLSGQVQIQTWCRGHGARLSKSHAKPLATRQVQSTWGQKFDLKGEVRGRESHQAACRLG